MGVFSMRVETQTLEDLYTKINSLEKENKELLEIINQKSIEIDGLSAILSGLSLLDKNDFIDTKMLLTAIGFVGDSLFNLNQDLRDM